MGHIHSWIPTLPCCVPPSEDRTPLGRHGGLHPEAPCREGSLEWESGLPELRNVGWPVWRWLARGGAQTKPDSWAAGSYGHPGQKVAHPVHGLH